MDEASIRSIVKKKLRRSINYSDLLVASLIPHTIYDAHDISEVKIRKLKLQLELNSVLLQEADGDGKKRLEEERKNLQDALALELEDGVEILNTVASNLRLKGREETARQFEILRDIRQSELDEIKGKSS